MTLDAARPDCIPTQARGNEEILGIVSIFKLLFSIVFKRKLGSYFASISYLTIYAIMLVDMNNTRIKALAEIDKNQTIFQSCCNRNSCEELGNKWTSKNNGVMVANVAGFGTNLHIYYIRQKNHYEVRTSVLFPPRYFSRFDCKT